MAKLSDLYHLSITSIHWPLTLHIFCFYSWTQILIATLQNLEKSLPRRQEVIIAGNGGLNLEWYVEKEHMGVIGKCSKSFGLIVFLSQGLIVWSFVFWLDSVCSVYQLLVSLKVGWKILVQCKRNLVKILLCIITCHTCHWLNLLCCFLPFSVPFTVSYGLWWFCCICSTKVKIICFKTFVHRIIV